MIVPVLLVLPCPMNGRIVRPDHDGPNVIPTAQTGDSTHELEDCPGAPAVSASSHPTHTRTDEEKLARKLAKAARKRERNKRNISGIYPSNKLALSTY